MRGTVQYLCGHGNPPLHYEGEDPMMLIVSILALFGALRFRKQAPPAAAIGQVSKEEAAA
jgi:hypothetical protein